MCLSHLSFHFPLQQRKTTPFTDTSVLTPFLPVIPIIKWTSLLYSWSGKHLCFLLLVKSTTIRLICILHVQGCRADSHFLFASHSRQLFMETNWIHSNTLSSTVRKEIVLYGLHLFLSKLFGKILCLLLPETGNSREISEWYGRKSRSIIKAGRRWKLRHEMCMCEGESHPMHFSCRWNL